MSTGRVDKLGVSASEGAWAYIHAIWLYIPWTRSSIVDSCRSNFVVYLGVLLCWSRLTMESSRDSGANRLAAVARLCVQDELCPLVNRGNAEKRLPLHRIMHHMLSDRERLVDDIGCRGSYNRRRRISRSFLQARTCRLLRYLDSVRQRYICTRIHALELVYTTIFAELPSQAPANSLRTFLQFVVVQVHHDGCAQIHGNPGRLRQWRLVRVSQYGDDVREV
jgi:hypothetical protein